MLLTGKFHTNQLPPRKIFIDLGFGFNLLKRFTYASGTNPRIAAPVALWANGYSVNSALLQQKSRAVNSRGGEKPPREPNSPAYISLCRNF